MKEEMKKPECTKPECPKAKLPETKRSKTELPEPECPKVKLPEPECPHTRIPEGAKRILSVLEQAGFRANLVGGCVRDMILNKEPKDWDITTSASPQTVQKLFRRTVDTGMKHGTVTVMMGKEGYEVTTYRIDGAYGDSRHPDSVVFTPSLEEDLKRRDFTINAMAYSQSEGIIDLFGGQEDLKKGVIRCVGDPYERFSEDALRILRALRFCAQLDFQIEERTARAISSLAGNLRKISRERVRAELELLLCSPHPERMRLAFQLGVTRVVLPDFDRMMETPQNHPCHNKTVGEHTLAVLQEVEPDHYLRWAALLHDVGKPEVRTTDDRGIDHFYGHEKVGAKKAGLILKELRSDRETMDVVAKLVEYHSLQKEYTRASVRRSVGKIGPELFPRFLKLAEADARAKNGSAREKSLSTLAFVKEVYEEILEKDECVTLKQLAVNGDDLMKLGIEKGPELGRILNELLAYVSEHPEENTRERLLKVAPTCTLK